MKWFKTIVVLGFLLISISVWAYDTNPQVAATQPCITIDQANALVAQSTSSCAAALITTYINICKGAIINGVQTDVDRVAQTNMCPTTPAVTTGEVVHGDGNTPATTMNGSSPVSTISTLKTKIANAIGGLKHMVHLIIIGLVLILLAIWFKKSLVNIGPAQVGLINKKYSFSKLKGDSPIAFNGEAGYQAKLLMPGTLQFVKWPFYTVTRFPWVQIPPGQIGIVVSQIGEALDSGSRTALYKPEFSSFTDLNTFIKNGGQKGVQRKVLLPGSLVPMHPVAFVVMTKNQRFGLPLSKLDNLNLDSKAFDLTVIPSAFDGAGHDVIGVVTALEGAPLEGGDIASRLGGFTDIAKAEENSDTKDTDLIEMILNTKNHLHQNYQDSQGFLDNGGKVGIQHDPLLPGSYALNPFMFQVALAPMLVVQQGQVAVIKSYVGLPTENTSGDEFKFGSLVKPGHRGVWREPVRTGKYAINPHCYQAEIVPTAILTLEWSNATGDASHLDRNLSPIAAKSREGFPFAIDLHVQIHVPDVEAPRVISMIGTMQNLVDELLQAAVGNHFRDKLQSLSATDFIEKRQEVQEDAFQHISAKLKDYHVETRGVYIQDVVMPHEITDVLQQRLVAKEQQDTYAAMKDAQTARQASEQAKGLADNQADLAKSEIDKTIKSNNAIARKSEADGESEYIRKTAAAEGIGKAEGYEKQVAALGQTGTTVVNALASIKQGTHIVPDVLVNGGGNILDAVLAQWVSHKQPIETITPKE